MMLAVSIVFPARAAVISLPPWNEQVGFEGARNARRREQSNINGHSSRTKHNANQGACVSPGSTTWREVRDKVTFGFETIFGKCLAEVRNLSHVTKHVLPYTEV